MHLSRIGMLKRVGANGGCTARKKAFDGDALTLFGGTDVVGQPVDIDESWTVLVIRIILPGIPGSVVVPASGLWGRSVLLLGGWVVLLLGGWVVLGSWCAVLLGLVGGGRVWVGDGLGSRSWGYSWGTVGSNVSLSHETSLSGGVTDDSLSALFVKDSVGALHGSVGKTGFLPEALSEWALASVVTEFVISGQFGSDVDVVNGGWWVIVSWVGSGQFVLRGIVVTMVLGESHRDHSADSYLK